MFCYHSPSQGFQLIVLSEHSSRKQAHTPGSNSVSAAPGIVSSLVMSRPCDIEPTEEYFLSIGRVFHKISLSGSAITVTRYRPRYHFDLLYAFHRHLTHTFVSVIEVNVNWKPAYLV